MQSVLSSLVDIGSSKDWLITANFILSVLLGLWMLRYRSLYIASRDEQKNNSDLIENLSEGIYRSCPDGRQLSANKALVKLNGYSSEAEMLASVVDIGKEWYVDRGRRDEFRAILRNEGKVEDFVSEVYRHKTREPIWVTESARLVYHKKTGKPLYYEGSVREITETIKRLKLEQRFQKLTRELPGGLFQFVFHADGGYSVPYLSEGIARLTGIPFERHLEKPEVFNECIIEQDREAYDQSLRDCTRTLEPWDHEFRLRATSGEEKWLRIMARPEQADGDTIWHGYVMDISTRKKHEMEIEELAYYDALTKLPNRRMFLNRMSNAIAACGRKSGYGALLFVDLDNFKTLNDTQGHDIGDAFLSQVSERLRRCVRQRDMVARIGGDEFVILLEDAGKDGPHATVRAITAANQILTALNKGFQLGRLHHLGSASIGVVIFDGAERRADEIMKRADIAMYQAKAAGRNGMALFDPVTMDRESQRYQLLNDLRLAFDQDHLTLHFQPQVDHTGRVTGAEALVRWNHPTLGLIMPDQFVALAEQSGLNNELARYVFTAGLKALAGWQRDPQMAHLRLALNVSVQSFSGDIFIPMVTQLIKAYGIDPSKLTFELTEHVMAKNHQRIALRMDEAKRLGVRLSLDDFGTGYSSLAYLKRLPFDEVKIDGSFVADIENAENDRALVKTILAMARTLGLTAVAEHVENVRQEAFLRAFGCDYLQGFLYSKALSAEQFLELFHGSQPALAEAEHLRQVI